MLTPKVPERRTGSPMTINEEENDKRKKDLRDFILSEATKGNIVLTTIGGLMVANLNEFVKQSTEGLLYDLNRDKATVITFLYDSKWINDFAVALVIERLKTIIEEYENESNKNPTGV
jgi:hypothetical protein